MKELGVDPMLNRLAAMRLGNPGGETAQGLAADGRSRVMRKREYWETRPHPAHVHHWLSDEFEAFLLEHSYPPNTLRDRMVERTRSIAAALKKGWYVPQAVMQEASGVEALDDAILSVMADEQAVSAEDHYRRMCERFVTQLAGLYPGSEDNATSALVLAALGGTKGPCQGTGNAVPSVQASTFEVAGMGWKLVAYMAHHVRRGGSTNVWMSVRVADMPLASLYGELCRVDGGRVDVVATRALMDGAVPVESIRAMMGWSWSPPVIHSSGSVRV